MRLTTKGGDLKQYRFGLEISRDHSPAVIVATSVWALDKWMKLAGHSMNDLQEFKAEWLVMLNPLA